MHDLILSSGKFWLAALLFAALSLHAPNVMAEMAYTPPSVQSNDPVPAPPAPLPEEIAPPMTPGTSADDVNAAVRANGAATTVNVATIIGTQCGDEGGFGYDRFSHQPLFCTQTHTWATFGGAHGAIMAIDSNGVSQTCDAACKANGAVCRFVLYNDTESDNDGAQVLRMVGGPKTAAGNYCSSWSGGFVGPGTYAYPTCICQTQ